MAWDNRNRRNMFYESENLELDCYRKWQAHLRAGQKWQMRYYAIGVPVAIISAVAGVSALTQFDRHNIIAGVLAILVAALTALTTFLNPSQRAAVHFKAGSKYESLRHDTSIFRAVNTANETPVQELAQELKRLNTERNSLDIASPPLTQRDLARAMRNTPTNLLSHTTYIG